MRIGITGASGQLGTGILRHLAGRIAGPDIVAVTRTPEKLGSFAAQGVAVRRGDFNDPAGLKETFAGIERLVIIPTSDLLPGVRPQQHRNAIEAAVSAGVGHLIYVSTLGARSGNAGGIMETHFDTEQALITSGRPWTLLRMSIYAEMLVDTARNALSNRTYAALPGAPAAYIVRDDLAAAAAGLAASNGHEGVAYHATGPASISADQIAEILSRIAGDTVRFSPITLEQFQAGLSGAGLPPALVNVIARFQQHLQAGAFDMVTGDVERLSGRPAASLEDFLRGALRQRAAQSGHA